MIDQLIPDRVRARYVADMPTEMSEQLRTERERLERLQGERSTADASVTRIRDELLEARIAGKATDDQEAGLAEARETLAALDRELDLVGVTVGELDERWIRSRHRADLDTAERKLLGVRKRYATSLERFSAMAEAFYAGLDELAAIHGEELDELTRLARLDGRSSLHMYGDATTPVMAGRLRKSLGFRNTNISGAASTVFAPSARDLVQLLAPSGASSVRKAV